MSSMNVTLSVLCCCFILSQDDYWQCLFVFLTGLRYRSIYQWGLHSAFFSIATVEDGPSYKRQFRRRSVALPSEGTHWQNVGRLNLGS